MRACWSLGVLGLLSTAVSAAEWPQFRGPAGDGHSAARGLPTAWSESEHVDWKAAIPGRGWSSPVIADGVVWLTTAVEHPATPEQTERALKTKLAGNPMAKQLNIVGSITLRAVAVDLATGKILRDVHLFDVADPEPVHSLNSYASPSPILDDDRLYCHFGTFGTAAVDVRSGTVLWRTRLPNEHSVGPGSSPALFEDKLIIPCDGTEAQYVTALDVNTGKPVWKTPRPPMTGDKGDLHKAFSTPLVIRHAGRVQVVIMGAQWVVAYEPRSGQELWRVRHGEGFSNVARPVFAHGLVYVCTGYMQHQLWAIRVDGQGDVTDTHVVWRVKRQVPAMPSPIVIDNEVYMVSDQGVATCLDALTGEQIWQQRVEGNYSASPLFADGKLFFCNREGRTTVVLPGREYREIAVNLLDGQLMASPVAVDGALLLRSQSHLYRLGNAAKP